jgi:phosphoglycolate phosphatase
MIGDRSHDVVGAKENGLISIGVLWGFGSRAELVDAGAQFLCEEPTMLTMLLSSNFTPQRAAVSGGR